MSEARISARAIQRLSTLDDYSFVRLCYNTILDREPDSDGLAAQLAALDAGHSRLEIVESLFNSPEFAVRDSDGTSTDSREAFFDAGGFLDPTMRHLLNGVAKRLNARVLFIDAAPTTPSADSDEPSTKGE